MPKHITAEEFFGARKPKQAEKEVKTKVIKKNVKKPLVRPVKAKAVVKKTLSFTAQDIIDILMKDYKGRQPITEKSNEFKLLKRFLDAGLGKYMLKPDEFIKALQNKETFPEFKRNSLSQYISLWAKFLRRAGSQRLAIDSGKLEEVTRMLYKQAKVLKQEYERNARNGVPNKRDVEWNTLVKAGTDYYRSVEHLYAKLKPTSKDFDALMNAVILMCYLLMPNIRSQWANLRRKFNHDTENGLKHFTQDNKMILMWNRRKANTKSYYQSVPEELVQILERWREFSGSDDFVFSRSGEGLSERALKQRVVRTWQKLINKPVGIRDMRHIQISYLEKTVTDPQVRKTIPLQFHHSRSEHENYFREVKMDDDDFVDEDFERSVDEESADDEEEEVEVEVEVGEEAEDEEEMDLVIDAI